MFGLIKGRAKSDDVKLKSKLNIELPPAVFISRFWREHNL